MASRDEYYALLSRALVGLDRDAFAARGAVYDREHKALLRRLFAPNSRLSDVEIDEEQWAFREAIRRIEFGDEPESVSLVPYRGASQDALVDAMPPTIPAQARDLDRPALPELQLPPPRRPSRKVNWSQRDGWTNPPPAAPAPLPDPVLSPMTHANGDGGAKPRSSKAPKRTRSVFRRVVRRTLVALVLIALGTAVYGTMTGQIQLPWLTRFVGHQLSLSSVAATDRAILFDGELSDQPDEKNIGKVVWRTTLEAGQDGGQAAVLYLDASIPHRNLVLSLSMRPEPGGSAMSHLLELRFLRPDRQPDDSIAGIGGIMTRAADPTAGRFMLAGKAVKVAPGVFLFGLAGLKGVREMSLQQLKSMRWLDIPLSYTTGAKGVLAIEKAGKAEQVVNDVLSKWEG